MPPHTYLVFKNNFMKLYEKEFIEIGTGREVVNGLFLNANIAYENRKPLFNTTNFAINKTDDVYSSNNPLQPNSDLLPAFAEHHLTKLSLSSRIVFGQKYDRLQKSVREELQQKYTSFNAMVADLSNENGIHVWWIL